MKPNFIIIGAARSGTTSLHKYIEAHPDIFMSEIKEINYFSNPRILSKGEKWYFSNFQGAAQKMIGEASTSYTEAPHRHEVPEKIFKLLGPIKLIYIIRDPIDRLISHYLHYIHRGQINESFHDMIKKKTHPMFKQGCYAYQLTQYLEYFPRENIHLLTINELKQKPEATVRDLYRFLEVDDDFHEVDFKKPHNVNMRISQKGKFGRNVLHLYHRYIEQTTIPFPFKKVVLKLAELNSSEIGKPVLNDTELRSLIQYYASDVNQLAKEFNVDINDWRDYTI